MRFNLAVLSAFFIALSPASAQQPGTVTNHAVPIGKGAGVQGYGSAVPATAGMPLISNGASADPTFQDIVRTGTIATGTWQGTIVAAGFGGTGQSTYTIGDLLQASASGTLAKLAAVATGNVLISGGVGTVSSWGKVGLTTHVTGILPKANGGLGAATLSSAIDTEFSSTQGSVLYRGASAWLALTPGSSGQLLASGGPAANPSWVTATGTGTVTSVVCGTGLSGGTITATGTCALALTNATLQGAPGAPGGVASNLMLGLGSTCHLTPVYSTRMLVTFTGNISNGGAGIFTNMALRFGTGSAPANGAAVSGTIVSGPLSVASSVNLTPFNLTAIITGLTASTAYWLDLSASPSGGTSSMGGVNCTAVEL